MNVDDQGEAPWLHGSHVTSLGPSFPICKVRGLYSLISVVLWNAIILSIYNWTFFSSLSNCIILQLSILKGNWATVKNKQLSLGVDPIPDFYLFSFREKDNYVCGPSSMSVFLIFFFSNLQHHTIRRRTTSIASVSPR